MARAQPAQNLVFTEYVRALEPESEPAEDSFKAAFAALRGCLVREIRRRGLWGAPPRYLGIHSAGESWGDGTPLEELLADCYIYVFIQRLRALRERAGIDTDIGGLVIRNVRNFLHDAQQRHDPLGYRIYRLLREAVQQLAEAGRLGMDGDGWHGNGRLRGDSRLSLLPANKAASDFEPSEELLQWAANTLVDDLLADLVTGWGRLDLIAELAERIARLPEEGLPAVRFGDLARGVRDEVRRRWQALKLEPDQETVDGDDGVEILEWPQVEDDLIRRQSFQRLLDCVDNGLDGLSRSSKTRDYLRRLWLFVGSWSGDAPEDKVLSNSAIAEALGIPRNRITGLKEMLREQVQRCRETRAANAGLPITEPASMSREATLRAMTRAALADPNTGRLPLAGIAEPERDVSTGRPPIQPPARPLHRPARRWRPRGVLALAATVFLAVALVLTVQRGVRDRERIEELTRERDALALPQVNLPVLFLSREGRQRGPDDPLVLPPATRRAVFVLEVVSPEQHAAYRVRVTAGDRVLWSSDALERTTAGTVSFELSRSVLAEGTLAIRVYGLDQEGEELLEDYVLAVRGAGPAEAEN